MDALSLWAYKTGERKGQGKNRRKNDNNLNIRINVRGAESNRRHKLLTEYFVIGGRAKRWSRKKNDKERPTPRQREWEREREKGTYEETPESDGNKYLRAENVHYQLHTGSLTVQWE